MSWITIIGLLVIAVGSGLTIFGTGVKSKEANDLLKAEIRAKDGEIGELIKGKDIVIQQNKDLSTRIKTYQIDLNQKQKKIEELEVFAKKDIYKSPSPELKKQVIDNLLTLVGIKEVNVSLFEGSNNGKRMLNDFIGLLKGANINAKIDKIGVSFGRGVQRTRMVMNKNTLPAAEQLAKGLSPYLKTKYDGKEDERLNDGIINIDIHGTPLFHQNGPIEFQ